MAVSRLTTLLSYIAACALPGCSGTEPSNPHKPPPTVFDFSGRYIGGWGVVVWDTARSCSFLGCENYVLEEVGCEVTTDFVMHGTGTFTGSFRIGPGGGPGASGICDVTATQWLDLALEGEIRAGTVDTVIGLQHQRISFNIGAGTRQDLERLFGCTLVEDWDTWRMHGGVAGRGTVSMYSPSSLLAFYASPVITLGQERRAYGAFNFECHGQRVIIQWRRFHGELVL